MRRSGGHLGQSAPVDKRIRRCTNVGQSEAVPEAELCGSAEDLLASDGVYPHAMQSALAEIAPRLKALCPGRDSGGSARVV